ncbi:hypothetical protein BDZ89DRAFT_1115794 [Hymenopellis radicata]|nr:hypothetical protein BDZ89DRAFT_1115794 [Hymenopellis radicata]
MPNHSATAPQQDYWEPSLQTSASYASLYDPYTFAAPPQPPQSLDTTRIAEEPSSPMSLYSPLSDAEYPYTPGTMSSTMGLELDGMDVVAPPPAPESHSVYPASQTSFDGMEVWPAHCQWPYLKHDTQVHGYSDASSYDDFDSRESGICVFQDGSYQILRPAPGPMSMNAGSDGIPVSNYYQYSYESAASSPLSPLSDPSQWQACQHGETSFTLLPSHSSASISSPNPDPIPLHQPRPTRRFNYQMMNDIAASLEASASAGH